MKHCAKKLLGLAFALALCLAVGGTAFAAQAPEFADVPAALPEQEMLAYEPNVATAADVPNTVTGDGYTVTIPTTVTVDSTQHTGALKVTAQLKQYRTLNITMKPQDGNWTLKYQDADAGTTTPEVKYQLPQEADMRLLDSGNGYWVYNPGEETDKKMLSFTTTTMTPSASPEKDMTRVENSSYELPITVPHPEQATMSGTYSDTVSFEFKLEKMCVTYTINVYGQKLVTKTDGWNNNGNEKYRAVDAVDVVDASGNVEAGVTPDETVTLEYKSSDAVTKTWTRTRPTNDNGEDERCWEDLAPVEMTPRTDFEQNKITEKTINLNLKRKWYWLDVNGIVNYTGGGNESTDGNGDVGCYLDIRASEDGKTTWSPWYWYKAGDDYWGTFPYGTHFEIGFHKLKDGYLYETDTSGNVKVIANGNVEYTTKEEDNSSPYQEKIYKVYEGRLTGKPKEDDTRSTSDGGNYHAEGEYQRYCFNVCCRNNTIIYHGNYGTAGNVTKEYNESDALPEYDALFTGTHGDMKFAGWSTVEHATSKTEVYQPGTLVKDVKWETTATPKHLYAIWGYDITVQFEDEKGYSTNDGRGPVATLGGTMDGYSFTLEKQVVADGADWTLDLTDPKVTKAIDNATTKAKEAAGDNRTEIDSDFVWKTDIEYKLSAAEVKSGKPLVIKRRRYLLSVISALTDTGSVLKVGKNPEIDEYGTFKIIVNGGSIPHLSNNDTSFYQQGLNYGASYTVSDPKPLNDTFVYSDYVILQSLAAGNKLGSEVTQDNIEKTTSYSSHVTGKKNNVHYYKPGDLDPEPVYTGDPVRVAFWEKTTTATPGPNRAPAKKALTLRYHANFDPMEEVALDLDPNPLLEDMDDTFGFDPDPLPEDVDDALEEAVKTVRYQPGEDVVLRNCMFKRGGYVFVGWNTEPDGTGKKYEVNGVPITDWAAGDTVDLYAQWKKPEHLKPVVDNEPFVPTDPDTPPEWVDDGFDADFGADPDPLPEGMDDAFGVDPAAQPEALDDAFGIDPDPLPEELDDAFGV